jgi:hypothetical protein
MKDERGKNKAEIANIMNRAYNLLYNEFKILWRGVVNQLNGTTQPGKSVRERVKRKEILQAKPISEYK